MLGEQRDCQWFIAKLIIHETDEHKSKRCFFFCETPVHRDLYLVYNQLSHQPL